MDQKKYKVFISKLLILFSLILSEVESTGFIHKTYDKSNETTQADHNLTFSFKKIFIDKVEDNMDGAFQAPIQQAFKELFQKNPRFELVDDANRADTLIKSRFEKLADGYHISISTYLHPSGDLFSLDETLITKEAEAQEIIKKVKQLLKTSLRRIPFYGTITGKEAQTVVLDIGMSQGIRKGDILQISRVDNPKRHPLLKKIVDIQLYPVGNVVVDTVEENLSFGKINIEIPGEKILKYYKITSIEANNQADLNYKIKDPKTIQEDEISLESKPKLGFVDMGLMLGSFSSSTSINSGTTVYSGSAFAPGFKLSGELWLTKNWFLDGFFSYQFLTYSQTNQSVPNTTTTNNSYSSTLRNIGFNGGYKYLPSNLISGAQIYAKLGYTSFNWGIQDSANDLLSSKTYSGFNLGIGGQIPLGGTDLWGAQIKINVLLFPSLSQGGYVLGSSPSSSGVNFYLGGYRNINPFFAAKFGMYFETYSANFENTVGTQATTNQKQFSFVPSISYFF